MKRFTNHRLSCHTRFPIEPGPSSIRLSGPVVEPGRRRGAAMVIALICLLLLSMIGTSLVKTALAQRHQVEKQYWQLQAQWLAEAGAERAAAQLAQNPDYGGETWSITAESLGGRYAGQVTIDIHRVNGKPNQREVAIVARFPDDPRQRATASKRVFVDLR